MRYSRGRGCGYLVAAALALAVFPAVVSAGGSYDNEPFSLRLAPPFMRFTEVSTIGGETVANRWSSAINPASADWNRLPCEHGVVIAPYYSQIMFDNGMRLHVTGESLTWQTGPYGTIQPTFSQVRSNRETTRQGLAFDYNVDSFQVQWAKRVDNWALGANFNFAKAEIIQDGQIGPAHVNAKGDAESYRFRFGGLYELAPKWLAGAIFEYGFQPYRSQNATKIPLPPPYPPMTQVLHDNGTQQQFIIRPGISYEYAPNSTVFMDYQYGVFTNRHGSLGDGRLTVGVDHQVFQFLFLRASAGVDNRGNASWTAGASMHFATWGSLDVGYQYDMYPELRPEFGRSKTFQATLSFRF
jgi:hypothetical protein